MHDKLEKLKDKALRLTDKPGVYLMKNKKNEVIYVGKAKVLRNRVVSYFRKFDSHDEKVKSMILNVYDFDFIVTDSEFEALVLECSLIKQHSPKYNILLKDDKGYHYIKISNEEFPRITAVMKKNDDGATYIGPYISSFVVKQAVEEVNKVFMLPTCTEKFGSGNKKKRPCLNYYIKRCLGLCSGNVNREEYAEIVKQAIDYLKNGSIQSIEKMKQQMEQASQDLDYERAIKLRDRISAIEKVTQKQKIYLKEDKDIDAIAYSTMDNYICFVVLKFRGGHIVDKDDYIFNDITDFDVAKEDFVGRYYSQNDDIPKLILIYDDKLDIDLYSSYITKQAGYSVKIKVPKRGEGKRLVDMVFSNASEQLASKLKYCGKEIIALQQLAELLDLEKPPSYIEAYDISNLGDTGIVGGMVVFENGVPSKKNYRKFSIKSVQVRDDYASMREMILRRIREYGKEKSTNAGFGRLPDLILIDGGSRHVAAVKQVFDQEGFYVPYFGMVKDSKHRTRAITSEGGEISISSLKNAFLLLAKIQDEVHRYTISYQRNVRKRTAFEIELTHIDGIGQKKALKLIRHFKSKTALIKSDIKKISKVANVSEEKAREISNFVKSL